MDCTLCVEDTCEGCDNNHDASEDSTCDWCGGERTWCDACEMWSAYCCEEYGTCQCS